MRALALRSGQFCEYGRLSPCLPVLARGASPFRTPWQDLGLHWQQALTLQFLTRDFAGARNGFRLLPGLPLGGFLIMAAKSHLAKNTFALHLLFQHPQRLVDIVVTDENLHERSSSMLRMGLAVNGSGGGLLLGPVFFLSCGSAIHPWPA